MDDNPQPPATKKARGVDKLNFLTKMKKKRESTTTISPTVFDYSDEIDFWEEEKIHEK
ncbi:hypothetical protein MKX01_034420 [Papaver californicum]|nr:hypothetical protein MKX01_034420 [Papaver californicum]